MKLNYSLFIIHCSFIILLGAQTPSAPWSLDQCVRYAVEHNLMVQQGALNVQLQENSLNTARNSVWPAISGSASQSFSFGRGISEDNTYVSSNTANTSFGIGGSMDLFTGLRVKSNIEMGKLNLAAATADLEKAKYDIRIAVTQAFVQILYAMEVCDVAQQQIAVDSVQVERLIALEEAGKANGAEVSAQRSALAQSRLTATQANNDLRLALLDLSQLLELPSPEGFSIARPEYNITDDSALPAADEVYADALRTMPSVKAEQLRVDCAKQNITLAQSGYYPTLSLSGGIVTDYYALLGMTGRGFGEQLKNNFSPYMGLSLNVPIFDRLVTRNNVRNAKLQLSGEQLQLENVKKSLYKEIQQAYYGAVAARDKYVSSQVAEESARETFDLVSAKYEVGKVSITEFNEAKSNFMQSTADLSKARYQFLYQVEVLEYYKGKYN